MANKTEGMAGGAPEVPPGYAEALEKYEKLGHADQKIIAEYHVRLVKNFMLAKEGIRREEIEKMFEASEGKIPPSISMPDEQKKELFVVAVRKFFHDKEEAERKEIKKGYKDPMPGEEITGVYSPQ